MPKKVMSTGMHSALALAILGIAFAYGGFFVQSQGGSDKVVDGIAKTTANAVNNVMPKMEVRPRRIGGASYHVRHESRARGK